MKSEQQILTETERNPASTNDLAIERTELALERTHLAWVRTIIGLISVGFAIDKGFSMLHQSRLASGEAWVNHGHLAGMIMTISGTVLIVIVTAYYILRLNSLRIMRGKRRLLLAPGLLLSILIFVIGLLLLYFMSMGQ
jgi:uncharacterized membrane protein YidH (DUF202 family)